MRQPRPGAGDSGLVCSLLLLLTLLWSFLFAVVECSRTSRAASNAKPAAVSVDSSNAVVTLGQHDGTVGSSRGHGIGRNAGLAFTQQRNLEDFELEDFVLLATVDGKLSARNRMTGGVRWELVTQEPAIRTQYHGKRRTSPGDLSTTDEEPDPEELVQWMVGPTEDGELYFYTPEGNGRLQKLGVTLKDIIHHMPYRPPGADKLYNGSKNTTTYAIDAKTGIIQRVFTTGGMSGMVNKKCKPTTKLADFDDDECSNGPSDKALMIGRTEYTISIQNWTTGELLWTITYNEWSPNSSDMDLRLQHRRPIDNRYIYGRHDGWIFGFDEVEGSTGEKRPRYNHDLQSPVVKIFDVIRHRGESESDDLLVLPQPQPAIRPKDDEFVDRTFVGIIGDGNCYAMSEQDFPYVTDRAADASCYKKISEWNRLPEQERHKLLVGIHRTHQPASEYFNPSLLALPGLESGTKDIDREDSSPRAAVPSHPGVPPALWRIEYPKVVASVAAFFILILVAVPKSGLRNRFKLPMSPLHAPGKIADSITQVDSLPLSPPTVVEPLPSDKAALVELDEVDELRAEPKPKTVKFKEPAEENASKAPTVRFDEPPKDPEVLDDPTNGVDNETGTVPPIPEKKKHARGRRGGRNKKKAVNPAEKPVETIEEEAQAKQDAPRHGAVTIVSSGQVEEIAPGAPFILNSLEIYEDEVIGAGSQGTTVHRGKWEGKLVAVKRILTTYADVAMKEVQTLQESDYHENVVRYYCQQQRGSFLYIALELCPGSLYDLVVKPQSFPNLAEYMDPRDTLYQIAHGLHHLHTLKIVHRDIKPQNILVGAPNPKSTRPRLLISDFGLCKKLQSDEYSFGATTAQHAGTVGWRAPELLQDHIASVLNGSSSYGSESSGSSGTDVVVDPLTKRRATRAIDIFALGCVCFFVLSRGQHPFGGRFSRELNIVKGNSDLSSLLILKDAGHEAIDLIDRMIQQNPKFRPDTAKVGTHPFFWNNEKRLDFLLAVSDRFELEQDREKNDHNYLSRHIPALERGARKVIGPSWFTKLDKYMYHELIQTKRRGYDETKLLHLLRAIRNKKHHFLDMPPETQRAVGEPPDAYYSYFAERFETLLMYTHSVVVETGLADEPRFKKFFQSPW